MAIDVEILTKIPELDYTEVAPEINENEFDKVIRSRRSVRVYDGSTVPGEVIEKAIDHALLAPNSSNLQPWRFIWVKSTAKKQQLVEACLGQSAAKTASELIIITARTRAWKGVRAQMLKVLEDNGAPAGARAYYEKIVPLAYDQGVLGIKGFVKKVIVAVRGLSKPTPRGPSSHADMRVWAHKTAALACENLMLSLRAQGYDTCPMEGFDEARVQTIIGPSLREKGQEICMVISVGRRAPNGIFGAQVRMSREQFVAEI